ncbi:MAG TPA: hypothetical protein VN944_09705 [Nitrospiria bacterium]|nr:hypothetical protein [Nitrospiria bacterium]
MKFAFEIVDQMSHVLSELPRTTNQLVKREMKTFAARFRKMFVKTHLSGQGEYSIAALGKLSKGGNFSSTVTGDDISNLVWTAKISKILRIHEEGGDITAKDGGYLSIGSREIYRGGIHSSKFAIEGGYIRRKLSVHIPARIHFKAEFDNAKPDLMARIKKAMDRSVTLSNDRNMARVQRMTW